jgi:diadenosine tetraphosphate (Ap4A) HIT family hydrolase
MSKNDTQDVLSWINFFNESKKRNIYPPKKVELFNRLIAHTNNFFVVAALGAFNPGYLMIITKELIPSLSQIKDNQLEELKWLINALKKSLKESYDRDVVLFEHGMCACVGGLDRAHLHMMTITKNLDDDLLIDTINEVLIKRKAGIKSVEFNGYKLENIHDINEILKSKDLSSYKIEGKQLSFENIKNDMDIKNWPISTRKHVMKGGHYVYFETNNLNTSFLTKENFQTQMGRQIVFEVELKKNNILKKYYKKIIDKNDYASMWRWQEFSFKENILKTMEDIIPSLLKIDTKNEFNFQTFEKKLS